MDSVIVDRKFKKKGNKVIFTQSASDTELDSKDIINMIDHNNAETAKLHEKINNLNSEIERVKASISANDEIGKKLSEHEDWAVSVQQAKVKALLDEVFDSCRDKVEATYKYDKGVSDEVNGFSKFRQLQQFIATSEPFANQIAPRIYRDLIFENSIVKNPWV